jgi:integral membrane sensor domain MASE1
MRVQDWNGSRAQRSAASIIVGCGGRDALVLALACAAGAAARATLGVAVLAVAIDTLHGSSDGGAALAWRAWAPGDIVGDIALMPLAGVWRVAPNWRRRPLEWWLGTALFVLVAAIAFGERVEALYLLFPFLVWAPMRLGRHGATATAVIIAIVLRSKVVVATRTYSV